MTNTPTIFISYSREDEAEKEALLKQLGVLQQEGLLETWSDDRIGAGADWQREIEAAMARARVAIFRWLRIFIRNLQPSAFPLHPSPNPFLSKSVVVLS